MVKIGVDDAFGNWLAGFIDGEGCFSMFKVKSAFCCEFNICLRDDDSEIIEEIAQRLGFGKAIYRLPGATTLDAKSQVVFRVRKKAECLALVHFLDRYPLRAKKLKDYIIWKNAVLLMNETKGGHRFRGPNLERNMALEVLKSDLHGVKEYVN